MVQADGLHITAEGLPPVFLQDEAEIIPVIMESLFQAVERYICVVEADITLQFVEEGLLANLGAAAVENRGIAGAESLQQADQKPPADMIISRQAA